MKLLIKETGEVLEDVKFIDTTLNKITIQYLDNGILREHSINSLSDIEEIKDYEEPKSGIRDVWFPDVIEGKNNVVISFETKEEAEKAVEKLKAWQRLENKGFRFRWIDMEDGHIKYGIFLEKWQKFTRKDEDDLLLLFGGEE